MKSVHGIPRPLFPRGIDLAREARTARRRFYPVTILYTAYFAVVVNLALRIRPATTLGFLGLGATAWTWLEYTVHRHVLHGRFADGAGWLQHSLHRFFDTMHGDHHQRPWDGLYINGFLDSLPFALAFSLLSFRAPLPTAPVMVAGILECYVIEEWVHYTVHFHRFRSRYFDYIRRHHLYHHSPRGRDLAFGLTNGMWDAVLGTRIPSRDRWLLYARGRARAADRPGTGPSDPLPRPAAVPSVAVWRRERDSNPR